MHGLSPRWLYSTDTTMSPQSSKSHRHITTARDRAESSDDTDWKCLSPAAEEIENAYQAIPNFNVDEKYPVPTKCAQGCFVNSMELYESMYRSSIENPKLFWDKAAKEYLSWILPYQDVKTENNEIGETLWFVDGKLNACENCVDRWAKKQPNKIALIIEPDDPVQRQTITYSQLLANVCRIANLLLHYRVRKGEIVTIYLPMIPEIAYTMLACARIGAIHSVVFGGYSATGLMERIVNSNSRILVTADYGMRGGKCIPLKAIADSSMAMTSNIEKCLVFIRNPDTVTLMPKRDVDASRKMMSMRPYCPPVPMDSEDILFVLYTSGSTGTPKGILHTTAGYMIHAAMSHKLVFDLRPNDVYGCLADCGWITGHSYVIYGPLCNGSTTVMMETLPTYPDPGRYWQMIQDLKLTQIYIAPTAIRSLMRFGEEWPAKFDLSSLRVIGSVGEPLNPEAWRWLRKNIGNDNCAIVDTYWQTETGGHILTTFPGATCSKPGAAGLPFFGVIPAILDPSTGMEIQDNAAHGIFCIKNSWPGMLRSIQNDHQRLSKTYFLPYPGYYFSGDGAYRDRDGYYWITGRVDDTLNVSGHRIATAEVEHALAAAPQIAESAVVGYKHAVKGLGIFCFVVLKACCAKALLDGDITNHDLITEFKLQVRRIIGPMATPDQVLIVDGLPKTRSGKIMRRILRKIVGNAADDLGDTAMMANPEVIPMLVSDVASLGLWESI